jgi:regulator of replication initiation timing
LETRVVELRVQINEYWNDQIEDQELEEELQLTRAERDRLRDAVGQSDLIIARQRNALMFHDQQTAMLNTQTMMLYQSNTGLMQNVNQLREAVRVLQAENDQLRAEVDQLQAQLAETDQLRAQLRHIQRESF